MKINSNQHKSIASGNPNAVNVVNNDLSSALKAWKKFTKNTELISKLRSNSEFEKKSDKRRKQKEAARFNEARNVQ